jgi:hypothetical protein
MNPARLRRLPQPIAGPLKGSSAGGEPNPFPADNNLVVLIDLAICPGYLEDRVWALRDAELTQPVGTTWQYSNAN